METDNGKKKTNAPHLRFPGFTGEWEERRLGEVCERVMRKNNNLSHRPLTISAQYGLIDQMSFFNKTVASPDLSNYILIKEGEFAYNKSSSSEHPWGSVKCLTIYSEGALSPLYICFAPKHTVIQNWLVQYYESSKWYKEISEIATEGARNHGLLNVSVPDFFQTKLHIPSKAEQRKIAGFLRLLDERIAAQRVLIGEMGRLMGGIISFEKMQGTKKGSWAKVFLRDVLQESKELNDKNNPIYSVSVNTGIVNQIEHLGRSFSSSNTSNYHIVNYGDVVYTKSPTAGFPYGIVKQSHIHMKVAVSPLYGVYQPINYNTGYLLHCYFSNCVNAYNYLHPLIQKGAKNTINISNQHFLDNTIPLPIKQVDVDRLVRPLEILDKKIELEKRILQDYLLQKQYLLRQMFI